MKNLITSAACIVILMVFVLQFTHSQIFHTRVTAVDQAVNNFKEVVRQEGCITLENEKKLKEDIAEILKCSQEEVQVDGDRTAKFRGEFIEYQVKVPLRSVIVVPEFWGISDEDNQGGYNIRRYTASEYLGR